MGYELGICYRTHLDYLREHRLVELLEIWNSYLIRTVVYLTQETIAGLRASHATIRGALTLNSCNELSQYFANDRGQRYSFSNIALQAALHFPIMYNSRGDSCPPPMLT